MFALRTTVALVAVGLGGALSWGFAVKERRLLLPGTTSDAHHVFDQACTACHAPFEGPQTDRCTRCHEHDLEGSLHKAAQFDDPRWADSRQRLDVTRCVTCHREHRPTARNVTVAATFCFECHDDVVERRPSHRDFGPASCQNAGCHNYHDDRGLNAAFLTRRLGGADTRAGAAMPVWGGAAVGGTPSAALHPAAVEGAAAAVAAWEPSAHATAGVGCPDCHADRGGAFDAHPGMAVCQRCHADELSTFQEGKHGVRGALGLAPLRAADARLPMKPGAAARTMTCSACHDPHTVDTRRAAVEACLGCHDDGHSRAFAASKHAATITAAGGTGRHSPAAVTCATCHLARVAGAGGRVYVDHNNNRTLRPRDRMLRAVCLECHGLELAFAALLDDGLVATNFGGPPRHVPQTMRMVKAAAMPENRHKEAQEP